VADSCDTPDVRPALESILRAIAQRGIALRFERDEPSPTPERREPRPGISERLSFDDPMVRKLVELFDARPIQYDVDNGPG
jgi:DNA polymerase-3 subunit gamma/tau